MTASKGINRPWGSVAAICLSLHDEHPDWSTTEIARASGIRVDQVSATLKANGVIVPKKHYTIGLPDRRHISVEIHADHHRKLSEMAKNNRSSMAAVVRDLIAAQIGEGSP